VVAGGLYNAITSAPIAPGLTLLSTGITRTPVLSPQILDIDDIT